MLTNTVSLVDLGGAARSETILRSDLLAIALSLMVFFISGKNRQLSSLEKVGLILLLVQFLHRLPLRTMLLIALQRRKLRRRAHV